MGFIFIILGVLLVIYLAYLIVRDKEQKGVQLTYKQEMEKYYDNMDALGYARWQANELLDQYKTLGDLKKVNKKMRIALEKMNS